MKTTIIGLDLAKNVFHSVDQSGKTRKYTRSTLRHYFVKAEHITIVMEACGGAHYWAREFQSMGHKVVLLPPQHVKAYRRGQKNDVNDAQAILEAWQHGRICPVVVKSQEQQAQQALIRVRQLQVSERTRLANQIRGLLYEYGEVLPQGIAPLRRRLPELLDSDTSMLPALVLELLQLQYQRLTALDNTLAMMDKRLAQQARTHDSCRRLTALPGFGPIVSCAVCSWMGNGHPFKRGREASAALGLVPRQHSSGDRPLLMGITKRGDAYIRSLIVHGARSVVRLAGKKTDPLSQWINRLVATRGKNKATVALANKLVRIAWVLIARGVDYQPRPAV